MVTHQQKNIIVNWIKGVLKKGTWPDHDLHIDVINPRIKHKPALWFDKAIEYFEFALSQTSGDDYRLILGVGLNDKQGKKRDISSLDINTLPEKEWDDVSPPSLYLYHRDHVAYKETMQLINKRPLYYKKFVYAIFERKDEWGDYNYSFLIAPSGVGRGD